MDSYVGEDLAYDVEKLEGRQLLGGLLDPILDPVKSGVDRILDRPRKTTTTPTPAEPTRAPNPPPQQDPPPEQQPQPPPPPPPAPTPTTTPRPQPQPTTPRPDTPAAPTPAPDNKTPRPAPAPAPSPSPDTKPEPGREPDREPERSPPQTPSQPEKPGSQPDNQGGNQPDNRPDNQPPGSQPDNQSGNQPDRQPVNQPDNQPDRQPDRAIQTDVRSGHPSTPISLPPQEEAHQPLPTGGADANPTDGNDVGPYPDMATGTGTGTPTLVNGDGSYPTNELPSFSDTDRGNNPSNGGDGGRGGGSGKQLDLTQQLALGFGLTLLVIIAVGLFFFIRRCRRKRRERHDEPFGPLNVPPSHPPMIQAMGPTPFLFPPHDAEAGHKHPQQFHNMSEKPTMQPAFPYAGEKGSQFDHQATTAAWAGPVPPPPPEPEEGSIIIKIFRWPTMSAKSTRTTASGDVSRSQSGKNSSRGSVSTLSTMLWRSRKSIARRKAEASLEGDGDEERMIPSPEPQEPTVNRGLVPPPLHIAHATKSERKDLLKALTKGRQQKRDSTQTVSSIDGRSIASSNVLSPTLMSFPVPPSTSSLSAFAAGDRDSLPPLPSTVYTPYTPKK